MTTSSSISVVSEKTLLVVSKGFVAGENPFEDEVTTEVDDDIEVVADFDIFSEPDDDDGRINL